MSFFPSDQSLGYFLLVYTLLYYTWFLIAPLFWLLSFSFYFLNTDLSIYHCLQEGWMNLYNDNMSQETGGSVIMKWMACKTH